MNRTTMWRCGRSFWLRALAALCLLATMGSAMAQALTITTPSPLPVARIGAA